ncbi:hypothetical protein KIN20_004154 [Parelaphostrongylus tenuis]|uniref:Uncharacterized protein n=1 Tax=Parelaphostrongylus tenuis TaxID=148309 RepID=A0AAD5QE84_PARTN|nr:hypothetical protein KIN20_004154 [Parelaphostrongylus tenuis]
MVLFKYFTRLSIQHSMNQLPRKLKRWSLLNPQLGLDGKASAKWYCSMRSTSLGLATVINARVS